MRSTSPLAEAGLEQPLGRPPAHEALRARAGVDPGRLDADDAPRAPSRRPPRCRSARPSPASRIRSRASPAGSGSGPSTSTSARSASCRRHGARRCARRAPRPATPRRSRPRRSPARTAPESATCGRPAAAGRGRPSTRSRRRRASRSAPRRSRIALLTPRHAGAREADRGLRAPRPGGRLAVSGGLTRSIYAPKRTRGASDRRTTLPEARLPGVPRPAHAAGDRVRLRAHARRVRGGLDPTAGAATPR